MSKTATPTAEELLNDYVEHREAGKEHYAAADEALAALVERLRPIRGKKVLTHASGRQFELVDQFAEKNTVFGHAGVRRYDLKELKSRA